MLVEIYGEQFIVTKEEQYLISLLVGDYELDERKLLYYLEQLIPQFINRYEERLNPPKKVDQHHIYYMFMLIQNIKDFALGEYVDKVNLEK